MNISGHGGVGVRRVLYYIYTVHRRHRLYLGIVLIISRFLSFTYLACIELSLYFCQQCQSMPLAFLLSNRYEMNFGGTATSCIVCLVDTAT